MMPDVSMGDVLVIVANLDGEPIGSFVTDSGGFAADSLAQLTDQHVRRILKECFDMRLADNGNERVVPIKALRLNAAALDIICGDIPAASLCVAASDSVQPHDLAVVGQAMAAALSAEIELLSLSKRSSGQMRLLEESKKAADEELSRSLQMMKLLYISDADMILTEFMNTMKEIYPEEEIELYFSQDHYNPVTNVKSLKINERSDSPHIRAFMDGNPVLHTDHDGGLIAVPLTGKQGVYGVLQIVWRGKRLDKPHYEFIRFAAETAGIAFEKAKLYEQSNFLVSELRIVNEITSRLSQSLNSNVIYEYALQELLQIFNAHFCTILELNYKKREMIVRSSNIPGKEEENFSLDTGISGYIFTTREPVFISDYLINTPAKSNLMDSSQSRSLIAAPIVVNGKVIGVVMVAHREPNHFSYGNYRLLQSLSAHIGLAMTNASLHEEVHRMVITDRLTELYTRHYLNEQVTRQQQTDECGSLIVLDIDNFKKINDTHGHQVGDQILVQVCRIILTSIRGRDVAARWGGEELAVYLPFAKGEQATRVAERIRTRVLQETSPQVTVSCGISEWNWEDEKISVETLFYRADMALYEAKRSGKNQVKML
jgi:diguanylate cyclase (GGDEF)-like protein